MGTYCTCESWLKLAFDCILMGFLLETVAMPSDFSGGSSEPLVVAMEVTAMVTYTTTLFLVVQLVFLSELEDSIVAKVVVSILSFASGRLS